MKSLSKPSIRRVVRRSFADDNYVYCGDAFMQQRDDSVAPHRTVLVLGANECTRPLIARALGTAKNDLASKDVQAYVALPNTVAAFKALEALQSQRAVTGTTVLLVGTDGRIDELPAPRIEDLRGRDL